MQSSAATPDEYLESLPEDRKGPMKKLREIVSSRIPGGFSEQMSYGMLGYVVPHSLYPAGYHCEPKLPLPFMNIASQKNFISVYHMGLYANEKILNWFVSEYAKVVPTKPDMGKGCVRFKNMARIPYELIGELAAKMTPEEWIALYEKGLKRS